MNKTKLDNLCFWVPAAPLTAGLMAVTPTREAILSTGGSGLGALEKIASGSGEILSNVSEPIVSAAGSAADFSGQVYEYLFHHDPQVFSTLSDGLSHLSNVNPSPLTVALGLEAGRQIIARPSFRKNLAYTAGYAARGAVDLAYRIVSTPIGILQDVYDALTNTAGWIGHELAIRLLKNSDIDNFSQVAINNLSTVELRNVYKERYKEIGKRLVHRIANSNIDYESSALPYAGIATIGQDKNQKDGLINSAVNYFANNIANVSVTAADFVVGTPIIGHGISYLTNSEKINPLGDWKTCTYNYDSPVRII
ncbi:hypothetical protein GF327_03915 [Candidatus Woesearchaeota archaeon]|nr:hypothetical protein [Candidatus Woesearchaeota archaeon]